MSKIPDLIFRPRSMAVVGASQDSGKLGHWVTKAFVDMGVCQNIYAVNPRLSPVLGLETVGNVKDIARNDVDLAVVIVPPASVPEAIRDCAQKSVKGIIVFSSSIGLDTDHETETVEYARRRGSRIIGPDSMGMYCPSGGLALFPNMSRESGSAAFISHSGAIAYTVSFYGVSRGVGFSKVIDCGNECDLTFTDFLEHFEEDASTSMVAGYIEGVKDGRKFLETAKRVSRTKPVVLLKAGTTPRSEEIVASHTGMLTGSSVIWDSAFRQGGLLRVDSIDELVDSLVMFEKLRLPEGTRLALISGTGGPLVMAADLCVATGFHVPRLSDKTRARIRGFLPAHGSSDCNPVDLSISAAVNPGLYGQAIEALGETDEVDILLLIHAGQWRGDEVADRVVEASRTTRKSVVMVMLGTPEKTAESIARAVHGGLPAFSSLERAVKSLALFMEHRRFTAGNDLTG